MLCGEERAKNMLNCFKKNQDVLTRLNITEKEYISNLEKYETIVTMTKSEFINLVEEYIEVGFRWNNDLYWVNMGGISTFEKVRQKLFTKERSVIRYALTPVSGSDFTPVEFTSLDGLLNFKLDGSRFEDIIEELEIFDY